MNCWDYCLKATENDCFDKLLCSHHPKPISSFKTIHHFVASIFLQLLTYVDVICSMPSMATLPRMYLLNIFENYIQLFFSCPCIRRAMGLFSFWIIATAIAIFLLHNVYRLDSPYFFFMGCSTEASEPLAFFLCYAIVFMICIR